MNSIGIVIHTETLRWAASLRHGRAGPESSKKCTALGSATRLMAAVLPSAWMHVVKPNQVDVFTFTVFRNLEQIDEP